MKEVFAQLVKGKYVFVHADSYYTGKWIHEHFHAKLYETIRKPVHILLYFEITEFITLNV